MDLGKVLDQVLQVLPDSEPFTVLPELWPHKSDLDSATGFGPRPMARHKFLKYLVQILRKYGISEAELEETEGLYSMRRVLTTLADIAEYQPHERLDVGGWSSRDTSAKMAMPNRYSDARLMTMAALKHSLVASAARAYQIARFKNPSKQDWTWEEVAAFWPERQRFSLEKDTESFSKNVKRKRDESPPPQIVAEDAAVNEDGSAASSDSDSADSVSDFDDPLCSGPFPGARGGICIFAAKED